MQLVLEKAIDGSAFPELKHILVFTLGKSRHALPLSDVQQVIRVVEITPLPQLPDFIRGVINIRGKVIPVIDLRTRLGLPSREMRLDDRFIIVTTIRRAVAILADSVAGIPELSGQDFVDATKDLSFAAGIKGMAKLDKELIPVYDLDTLLKWDENAGIVSEWEVPR